MTVKTVLVKIGSTIKKVIVWIAHRIWNLLKWIGRGFKWVGRRLRRWHYRTKNKASRIYVIYACFMSGIIGFGKSVKAQYKVWKNKRKAILNPIFEDDEEEVLEVL